ncbi:MAG: carboxypeptidase-like regulatory domain-containing protein [Planctomycetota bacterium]
MQNRAIVALLGVAVVVAAILFATLQGDPDLPAPIGADGTAQQQDPAAATGERVGAASAGVAVADGDVRAAVDAGRATTGVRGIVLDARTGQPLGGVEVIAVKDQPSLAPLIDRFRGLFQQGMFVDTRAPRRELGRTVSNPDGTFELTGLSAGRLFLDGRSDGWFVRTPASARLADGQIVEGVELRASPGGRVRGVVIGPDGAPAANAGVSVRPGLNAFFGQLTDRQYRWLDTVTDAQGRFDIPGVPAGQGYTVAATGEAIAIEEVHGVEVQQGAVTTLTLQTHAGALVAGRVLDPDGAPVAGANVAMVYLDISRILFSADGRTEPVVTDADGRFQLEHVAAGRVAFVAAAADLAPSDIPELAVVDGGIYDDLVLQLGTGATVTGRVVDDQQQPVAGAAVELRPFERPDDPQFLKMMLKVRRVEATTDAAGRFVARGLTGERLVVQASKPGYTTAIKSGVPLDDPDLVVEVQRGVTIKGRVMAGEEAIVRFRVDTQSREIPKDKDGNVIAVDAAGDRGERSRRGPPWQGGGPGMRSGTRQLAEGERMGDRGMDGNWREVQAVDGRFELRGIPPGRVRIRVRADGFLEPQNQTIDLAPGATSDELLFVLGEGEPVAGRVVDEAGVPVSDAQVTAYKQSGDGRRGPFNFQIDPEDFDFLALSGNRRTTISDSKGAFTVTSLEPGTYRFTARHPDMAKSSATEVEVVAGKPTPPVEITLDAGGGVEGTVTGLGMRPLPDALMVAFSLQAGTMRSSTTDARGFYRIDGLPPGQYLVFKSRLDERADNIPLELMSNMRLKTVTVKRGKFVTCDVQDEGEDGVRVFGVVREAGKPVPRALVTLLGSDKDGLLGMGMRANAAGMDGRYELIGIKPGDYVMQVTRFLGQPVQTTFEVEIPDDVREYVFDIELPTSVLRGRVVDTRGNPVAGLQVTLGSDEGGLSGADGLIGMIAQNGLSQARTDDDGAFTMKSIAAGNYHLTAGRQLGGRPRRVREGEPAYGEGRLDGVIVDGVSELSDLVVVVPLAGTITGLVVDGSGVPVANAEVSYDRTDEQRRRKAGNPLLDLVAAQAPVRSDADGRFTIRGLTPGAYSLRVESEALEAGKLDDVRIAEEQTVDVKLQMVRGAILKVRATNVDKQAIPIGDITLLDGNGKAVVSRVSTLTVMKRLMSGKDTVDDSGWFTFGSVPPDTYTAILREAGQPEVRITRTIRDGETVEWDIDVGAELEAQRRANEKNGR